jgi:hypothetical protein
MAPRSNPNCTVKVKALKPEFVRQRHLGPVSSRQAKARIERTAALMIGRGQQ